jgi:hypothetical protein
MTNMTTIGEAKDKLKSVSLKIRTAITEWEHESGMKVTGIRIERTDVSPHGGPRESLVNVKLEATMTGGY